MSGWGQLWLWVLVGCGSPATTPTNRAECGGITGAPCEDGQTCFDAPDDACDPLGGGADCPGVCFDCEDPELGRTYLSRNPEECAVVDFNCESDEFGFGDSCGCGCASRPQPAP